MIKLYHFLVNIMEKPENLKMERKETFVENVMVKMHNILQNTMLTIHIFGEHN